jgi:hypothetical protein
MSTNISKPSMGVFHHTA